MFVNAGPPANLFGGSPEEVTHSPSVTQPLVQHRNDAHEQSVTHALDPVVFICDRAETEVSDWVSLERGYEGETVSKSLLEITVALEKERAAIVAI